MNLEEGVRLLFGMELADYFAAMMTPKEWLRYEHSTLSDGLWTSDGPYGSATCRVADPEQFALCWLARDEVRRLMRERTSPAERYRDIEIQMMYNRRAELQAMCDVDAKGEDDEPQ